MYPLLRPGSFVQIDSHATRTPAADWQTEFDRPIYFVELRDGDACAWCEMRGAQITLIPHPLSACTIRQFAYPNEAEIIGQVTAVAMRLLTKAERPRDAPPRLPRRA